MSIADPDILTAGRLLLRRHADAVVVCERPDQIPQLMEEHRFDAILLDMNFGPGESSGAQGFRWLERILTIDRDAVVVMLTAHGGVDVAVEAMKRGATDFVTKPWQNERVVATLTTACRLRQSRTETTRLEQTNRVLAAAATGSPSPILGRSEAMRAVFSLIRRAAPTDANVLVLGENGTGKGLVAREIHQQSRRAEQVFLPVDLGAVAESLFESELFGHRKGAFTGASEDRVGRLQAADGGTLFLDEVGNIPLHLQGKLLTVLEQRQVTPVGANRASSFDVRVIAATNLSPTELGDPNRFRPDLLFRLNTVEITVPPLRDRRADIAEIAAHYATVYARRHGKSDKPLTSEALELISAWSWPGNVRALRHAVERAVVLSETVALTPVDFHLPIASGAPDQERAIGSTLAAAALGSSDDLNLERLEKEAVRRALEKHQHNVSQAAKELGLTRAALYRRMEKHGL